jgi:hypothetical protein
MKKIILAFLFSSIMCFPIITQEDITPINLQITCKKIDTQKIMSDSLYQIRHNRDYLLFFNNRKIIIKIGDQIKDFCEIFPYQYQPDDYFIEVYLDNEYLLISYYDYPEEVEQSDSSAPLGGYKRGPEAKGMIFINLANKELKIIKSLPVSNYKEFAEKSLETDQIHEKDLQRYIQTTDTMIPTFYSIIREGNTFILSGIGYVAALTMKPSMMLSYIEFDYEYILTRYSLYKNENDLWYVINEGGMSGSWVVYYNMKTQKSNAVYTKPDSYIYPNSIVGYKGKIFHSSRAGLQEINKQGCTLHQYVIDDRFAYHLLYGLRLYNNALWAISPLGIVEFNLGNNTAVLYKLNNIEVIYDFDIVDGITYITTKNHIVTAPLLHFEREQIEK